MSIATKRGDQGETSLVGNVRVSKGAARVEAYGGLQEQIRSLLTTTQSAQREASRLANALQSPTVRGSWGESTLRRCIEMAGMSEFCDFSVQETFAGIEGHRIRPDLIVRLPNKRVIAVDAKVPLSDFTLAANETDEARRREHLAQHVKTVRRHIDTLRKFADTRPGEPRLEGQRQLAQAFRESVAVERLAMIGVDEHGPGCHEIALDTARTPGEQQALIAAGNEGLQAATARTRATGQLLVSRMPIPG